MTSAEDSMGGLGSGSDTPGVAITVGQLLRRQRVKKGLTLSDIAKETRIPLRHLTAIEQDSHKRLPALTYAIGFVKNYAQQVGLPEEALAAQFRAEAQPLTVQTKTILEPMPLYRGPSAWLALIAIVVAITLLTLWWQQGQEAAPPVQRAAPQTAARAPVVPAPALPAPIAAPLPETALVPEATPLAAPSPLPQEALDAAPATVAPTPTPQMPDQTLTPTTPAAFKIPPKATLVLVAREDSWVKIRRPDGTTLKIGVLNKGERFVVPQERGLILLTGNAGALEIQADGQSLPPLGQRGEIARNVELSPAGLEARLAPPAPPPSPPVR